MNQRQRLLMISFLIILLASGCGLGFDLNIKTEQKTGPTATDEILIPQTFSSFPVETNLAFGAGKMILLPYPGDEFIAGTATYNVADFKPTIDRSDSSVSITQGNLKLNAFPTIDDTIKNEWSLAIGDIPIDLSIKAGGYSGDFELGGLSITELHITDGASNVNLAFSTPNQEQMRAFRYETGASNITMEKLANANFQTMIFQSGAGNYQLDFSGFLQQDASIFIETGLSRLVISVPEEVPAEVSFEGPLSNVTAKGSWQENGADYFQVGQGPKLIFTIETKAGTTTLRNP